MATNITIRANYSKSADEVMAAWGDAAFFQAKGEKMGARSIDVNVNDSGDTLTIKYNREETSDADIPGFAKKFVAEWNKVTQTDTWDKAGKTGTIKLEVSGTPVDISCAMKLTDGGGSSSVEFNWTLKCGIPLVGGKLEKLLAEDIQLKAPRDEAASNEVLG